MAFFQIFRHQRGGRRKTGGGKRPPARTMGKQTMDNNRKTRTICFTNNKGGSGKSTSCANLGYGLAAAGKKVLLIDGDMQLNLSLSFFDEDRVLDMAESERNLYDAIRSGADL